MFYRPQIYVLVRNDCTVQWCNMVTAPATVAGWIIHTVHILRASFERRIVQRLLQVKVNCIGSLLFLHAFPIVNERTNLLNWSFRWLWRLSSVSITEDWALFVRRTFIFLCFSDMESSWKCLKWQSSRSLIRLKLSLFLSKQIRRKVGLVHK